MAVPPPADPALSAKRALRARLRGLRDAFAASGPPPILPPPAYSSRLCRGLVVASYLPLGGEADPALLVAAARDAGCTIALPRLTTRAAPMAFADADAGALEAGPFGLQPAASLPPLAPDLILAPLVGFDANGNRLGQGGGHYDRAFAAYPAAWRLGVAWSVQSVDALPLEPWDLPLDGIVTEAGTWMRED